MTESTDSFFSTQDDIKEQIDGLSGRVAVIVADYINNLSDQFDGVQKRISDNLKKLRIGVIHSTIDKIIQRILEEEMAGIKQELEIKFHDYIDVMNDGIVVPKVKISKTQVEKPTISKPHVKTLEKAAKPKVKTLEKAAKPKVKSIEKPVIPKPKVKSLEKPVIPKPKVLSLEKPKIPKAKLPKNKK